MAPTSDDEKHEDKEILKEMSLTLESQNETKLRESKVIMDKI